VKNEHYGSSLQKDKELGIQKADRWDLMEM
jgi:hypothetical protein